MWPGARALGILAIVAALNAASGAAIAAELPFTGQGTPRPAGGSSGLADMLALAPDLPAAPEAPGFQIAQFADSAAQMAAVGVDRPMPGDNDELSHWLWANWWMPFPDTLRNRAFDERWSETFGFDVTQVDRSVVVGEVPLTVAIHQGRFNEWTLRAAWEASGYQPVDLPGALVYSIAEEETIDFSSDIAALALAHMNNVALLPDGTLITASRLDNLERALATMSGEAPSLLDRPDVAALVAAGDPGLVAAFVLSGEALRQVDPATIEASEGEAAARATAAAEERARFGAMPAPDLALIGLTPGGPLINEPTNELGTPEPFLDDPPVARFVVSLLYSDHEAAESAVPIIDRRLASGGSLYVERSYAEFFARWTISVSAETPVLVLELTYVDATPPEIGIAMYVRRDLGFVTW